jgi:hypothetical protein
MWPLDNSIYKDYASWKIENSETLEVFNDNSSVIYERLEPVYVVLNHIYDMVVEKKDVDEDLETIFQVGFNYLNTQFDIIKIYYETLFQSKCDDFVEYSDMILFLLYIFDLRADMESNDIDSDIEELNDLETNIENMIMEKRDDHEFINSKMNETLSIVFDLMDYEYVSIIDVFVEIAENLGLFIYEDKELVIGREI